MAQISNANGVVAVEGSEAVGYRHGKEICRMVLPLTRGEAEGIIHLCLDEYDQSPIGVTGEAFIKQNLMRISGN